MADLKNPFCPTCHTMREGKFCFACGAGLVEGKGACAGCGYAGLMAHHKFCRQCGAPYTPQEVSQ